MGFFYRYLRCSSDEQTESGHGLHAQADQCAAYASRHGGEIVATFSDEGISGGAPLEKRPGLMSAIAGLSEGDTLLVAKRDRIARDPIITALAEAAVARRGARLISAAGEGTDGDDPASILMRRIVDAFAEHEKLVIRVRTKAALQAKKARKECCGHIPWGYRLAPDGKHLEAEPLEQEILNTIRFLRKEGMTLREVADEMKARNLKNRGKEWNQVSISRACRRKAA